MEEKEGVNVYLVMLYASRIIAGKYEYKNAPASLKPQIKAVLEEQGFGNLAVE